MNKLTLARQKAGLDYQKAAWQLSYVTGKNYKPQDIERMEKAPKDVTIIEAEAFCRLYNKTYDELFGGAL